MKNCLLISEFHPEEIENYRKDNVDFYENPLLISEFLQYVENDVMLIFVDILLQKVAAYRHVLFNSGLESQWRLAMVFILCDAYYRWVHGQEYSVDIYDLEFRFYTSFLESFAEILIFIAIFVGFFSFSGISGTSKTVSGISLRILVESLLVSFYGNVFLVLIIIWNEESTLIHFALIQILILISHLQTLRALFADLSVWKCGLLTLFAYGTRLAFFPFLRAIF